MNPCSRRPLSFAGRDSRSCFEHLQASAADADAVLACLTPHSKLQIQLFLRAFYNHPQVSAADADAVLACLASLLELVPPLLAAAAQFPAATPLHQFWLNPTVPNGLSPAMLLATYVAFPHSRVRGSRHFHHHANNVAGP